MAVTAALRSKVQAALRRQRPHAVKVYKVDSDDAMTISPTGERGRWERVVAAIPPTAERIEFVDAKGGTLFAMDIEQPDSATALDGGDRDTKLLALLLKAQEMALDRQTASLTGVMKGYENLARLMADRLTSLEKGYSQVLSAAFESTLMAAEAQAKLNGEVDKGENESAIDKLAGEVLSKFVGGSAPANGASPSVVQKALDSKAKPGSPVVQKG
jgi:hypothetical protein